MATAGQSYGLANSSAKTSGRAVAGATLAVAAVFQLAPRRIQRVVARRLKRRRDDAGQTTSTWLESERITARRENR